MSILIKGLVMPNAHQVRPFYLKGNGDGTATVYEYTTGMQTGVAIPLPEKHGRLGDLDALEDAFIRYYLGQERQNHLIFTPVEIKQHFADMIGDWPTIIEAEGG